MRGQPVVWSCIVALSSLVWMSIGCGGTEGDYVFLESRDAVMPVWTKGQSDGGTFVVHVHGGPGNTSIGYGAGEVFDQIESQSGVTYWDQRGAGSAQGDAAAESLTVDQYAVDLAKTITLIRQRHDVENLFLLSHGFGVNVVAEYLQDEDRQAAIDGWIFVDGNYDVPMSISLSRDWILQVADAEIESGNDRGKWQDIVDWYEDHPTIDTGDEYREHREHIEDANGFNATDDHKLDRDFFDRVVTSPHGELAVPVNDNRTQRVFWDREGSLDLRFTDQMREITTPTLVVWGANDGLTPVPMADNALQTLGTVQDDKRLVTLEESAHHPELDQNERFQREVNAFIDNYE